MEDNLIKQYDEIDNIHRTLEKLISEITLPELKFYKEDLQEIMFTAQDDLEKTEEELCKEELLNIEELEKFENTNFYDM